MRTRRDEGGRAVEVTIAAPDHPPIESPVVGPCTRADWACVRLAADGCGWMTPFGVIPVTGSLTIRVPSGSRRDVLRVVRQVGSRRRVPATLRELRRFVARGHVPPDGVSVVSAGDTPIDIRYLDVRVSTDEFPEQSARGRDEALRLIDKLIGRLGPHWPQISRDEFCGERGNDAASEGHQNEVPQKGGDGDETAPATAGGAGEDLNDSAARARLTPRTAGADGLISDERGIPGTAHCGGGPGDPGRRGIDAGSEGPCPELTEALPGAPGGSGPAASDTPGESWGGAWGADGSGAPASDNLAPDDNAGGEAPSPAGTTNRSLSSVDTAADTGERAARALLAEAQRVGGDALDEARSLAAALRRGDAARILAAARGCRRWGQPALQRLVEAAGGDIVDSDAIRRSERGIAAIRRLLQGVPASNALPVLASRRTVPKGAEPWRRAVVALIDEELRGGLSEEDAARLYRAAASSSRREVLQALSGLRSTCDPTWLDCWVARAVATHPDAQTEDGLREAAADYIRAIQRGDRRRAEDALRRFREAERGAARRAFDELASTTASHSYGGAHVSLAEAWREAANIRESRRIARQLERLVERTVGSRGKRSPRIDAAKLVGELAAKSLRLGRCHRRELDARTIVLGIDWSGSCSSSCSELLAAALSVARRDSRVVVICHSNGLIETAYCQDQSRISREVRDAIDSFERPDSLGPNAGGVIRARTLAAWRSIGSRCGLLVLFGDHDAERYYAEAAAAARRNSCRPRIAWLHNYSCSVGPRVPARGHSLREPWLGERDVLVLGVGGAAGALAGLQLVNESVHG